MIECSYGSSRGNKIWIRFFIEESEAICFYVSVELNKNKTLSKINYIIERIDDIKIGRTLSEKDITIEELKKHGYNNNFIKEAWDFAEEKGYTKRWK